MYFILYVVLIVIMSYFIMYFISDDKNKGDQSLLSKLPTPSIVPGLLFRITHIYIYINCYMGISYMICEI